MADPETIAEKDTRCNGEPCLWESSGGCAQPCTPPPAAERDAPVLPEDWCHHHPEMADNAGRCQHPRCTVAGPQVRPTSPAGSEAGR